MISHKIQKIRQDRGLSMMKLSKMANMKIGQLRSLERTKNPRLSSLIRIAHAFDCSIDNLVDEVAESVLLDEWAQKRKTEAQKKIR